MLNYQRVIYRNMWNHLTWAVRFSWPNIRKLVDPKPPKTGAARPPVERDALASARFPPVDGFEYDLCVPLEKHILLSNELDFVRWIPWWSLLGFKVGLSRSGIDTERVFNNPEGSMISTSKYLPIPSFVIKSLGRFFLDPFFREILREHPIFTVPSGKLT